MVDYSKMSDEELKTELEKLEEFQQDARDERAFLGKQTSMHIEVAEFTRIDQEIEKFGERIEEVKRIIAERAAQG